MFHYDLAIIGGGPAGLSAAATAIDAKLNFVIIAPTLGGKVKYGFAMRGDAVTKEAWGVESATYLEEKIKKYPDRHVNKTVSSIVREDNGLFRLTIVGAQGVEQTVRSAALIVATGAQPQQLYIRGEDDYWGRGITYSTTSHAGLMEGRDVAVIGLGFRAIAAASRLLTVANHVYLIPRSRLSDADLQQSNIFKHPNLTVLSGWSPERFSGNEFLEELHISHEREFRTLDIDAAFIELGLLPDKGFLTGLVEFDPETGEIPINQRCETEISGLFAAGDVTNILSERIPVAVGEGIKAALSAWEFIAGHRASQTEVTQSEPQVATAG